MKKILIITLEYPPDIGGVASYVHQFAEELDPQNTIVYAPKIKDDEKWDKVQKYKVIRKKPYYPKFIWPRWIRLYFQISSIVKKEGIEMMLIHHSLPVGYIGLLIKKSKKIPYIIFSHGTDVLAGTSTKWKRKMIKKVTAGADAVVFNSESLKRRLTRVLPEVEEKSVVVYPCPLDDFYTPVSKELINNLKAQYALEGKKIILSIGRIEDGKGYTHLMRVLPKILKKTPNLVWLIIGEGPKKKFLVDEMQKHNLQNIVRFIGQVPHNQVKPFYYLADLFVLLTHPDNGKEEGLGMVFLEAAACGKPVVAGRSGGVPEAVIHTQTGLIVDVNQGDPVIVDAITQILLNESYSDRIGKQAQDRMKEEFQWKHQLARLDKWIKGDIKSRGYRIKKEI